MQQAMSAPYFTAACHSHHSHGGDGLISALPSKELGPQDSMPSRAVAACAVQMLVSGAATEDHRNASDGTHGCHQFFKRLQRSIEMANPAGFSTISTIDSSMANRQTLQTHG